MSVERRAFSLIEVMTALALSAIIATAAIGVFSALLSSLVTWRSRVAIDRRASIASEWINNELSVAGGGPLPRRLAVAVDGEGGLHVLDVIPPAVQARSVFERRSCSGLNCNVELDPITDVITYMPPQWPLPLRRVTATTIEVPTSSPSRCPPASTSASNSPLGYLALVAADEIALVLPTRVRFEPDNSVCVYTIAETDFPMTSSVDDRFNGGAAVPVRWHVFRHDASAQALRSSWQGRPPQRTVMSDSGPQRVNLPNEEVAITQLGRMEVRFGEDTDDDGIVDVWRAPGDLPVARRHAVEVAVVVSAPSSRAPARLLTLPSGALFSSPVGRVAELAVTRVTLGAVAR